MNKSYPRILYILAMSTSLFFLPVWITALAALVFSVFFSNPFEAVLVGYLLDVLYGVPGQGFVAAHLFIIIFLVLFLLSFWIREHLTVGL